MNIGVACVVHLMVTLSVDVRKEKVRRHPIVDKVLVSGETRCWAVGLLGCWAARGSRPVSAMVLHLGDHYSHKLCFREVYMQDCVILNPKQPCW